MGVRRLLNGLVVGAALALGVSACGGDNDPSNEPPTTAPPEPADTRPSTSGESRFPADFVKQVDPICTKAQDEIDKLVVDEIRDPAKLKQLTGVFADTAAELEALEPPEENVSAYQEFTDAFRDGERNFTQLEGEVERGDSSAYQRVNSTLDEVETDLRDQASQNGFEACAAG